MTAHDYLSRWVRLLASTMPVFQLNYYIFGDDTDFCFTLSVQPADPIERIGRAIQRHYLDYMGVKLLFPKLFKINQPQDKMVDIVVPATQCMKFGKLVGDYWADDIDSDHVHILVVAGSE
jgi:hypothetical protein